MKKLLFTLLALLCTIQQSYAMDINSAIEKYVTPVSDKVASVIFFPVSICGVDVPVIILWILVAVLFFSFYLRGIAIWGLKESVRVLKTPSKDSSGGEVSPLGALMTALSGTVGLGCIAGVAISISIGGPGAAFWIMFGAIFGMALKF